VADEVRSLAQNTQNSTSEIKAMIAKVQDGAKASVQSMLSGQEQAEGIVGQTTEVKNALGDIKNAVHSITEMTTQIASAAEQQSATASEVSQRTVEIREQAEQIGRLPPLRNICQNYPYSSMKRYHNLRCNNVRRDA
jgi:methyl-accepting chemotaxis protein